ncbi:hypothetical protein HYPSUDRAFT_609686 [Hypholoma sublateritium FD-334 SS-4]|uniref:Secreted protein n=1 Tax=Hypholoma sublateritium (strain FD-334 SS-4) TaxID=945553 RepID=A0A0D2MH29_HYPSF|nr:hypothetical protein HYPSUDRAFT_609686 [Hypholoma sublateritium FD-334 SS-4]
MVDLLVLFCCFYKGGLCSTICSYMTFKQTITFPHCNDLCLHYGLQHTPQHRSGITTWMTDLTLVETECLAAVLSTLRVCLWGCFPLNLSFSIRPGRISILCLVSIPSHCSMCRRLSGQTTHVVGTT